MVLSPLENKSGTSFGLLVKNTTKDGGRTRNSFNESLQRVSFAHHHHYFNWFKSSEIAKSSIKRQEINSSFS